MAELQGSLHLHLDNTNLFYSSIEKIFYSYAKRRYNNFISWIYTKELAKKFECVSDKEFVSQNQPPWKLINDILSDNNMPYFFEEIGIEPFIESTAIEFKIIRKVDGKKIDFSNLSSGEKIILGLIIKIFTTNFYMEKLELPSLLALDEPDSHLHPELTKLLMDVLQGTFVGKLGMKVLITTHSPSTVALAPDESLYELTNVPNTKLKQVSKDQALKTLTFGVSTLSIDYKNHRQVFVESPTDAFYFQSIYDTIVKNQPLLFKPYFISYSRGKGNCEQVYDLVKKLRHAGNTKAFGVVDWDLKNKPNEFVFVHGLGSHYSIESFLYHPIYLAIYFLEINHAEGIGQLNFQKTYNQYSLVQESEERLQEVVQWVTSKVVSKYQVLKTDEFASVEFWNGRAIKTPTWYLNIRGHELEQKLKETFASLKGKFRGEGEMQEAFTKIACKSYPFVPKQSVELIKEISNGN